MRNRIKKFYKDHKSELVRVSYYSAGFVIGGYFCHKMTKRNLEIIQIAGHVDEAGKRWLELGHRNGDTLEIRGIDPE